MNNFIQNFLDLVNSNYSQTGANPMPGHTVKEKKKNKKKKKKSK